MKTYRHNDILTVVIYLRTYFTKTAHLGFSHWNKSDISLARILWGDPKVTRFICAHGAFTEDEISAKLENEIQNLQNHGTQYFPIFELSTGDFVGCCGVHFFDGRYELGYHLRPEFWGRGYATEAAKAAMEIFAEKHPDETLYAGHHPDHVVSSHILKKIGFEQFRTVFYEPTGLQHPLYTKKQS